ncbi:uncharacterized protein PHALS_11419 [Plasmopara halstedii]|uniref:Uncharacterized protein n=1 Tax=Plasmopara halstedii TaxID=4781 RepID=A0A0P1A5E6_PLAHL|nr:uncharacterized protein PHALS_11419 [Plasmopara halstedii]CEG35543.1 hypothetical protein PHALS_11419 [Plasmopara halstedii]|eukprot:XP_024571912.1 hypothetical protein PHALS_11419 [Plasmopara halstedii]
MERRFQVRGGRWSPVCCHFREFEARFPGIKLALTLIFYYVLASFGDHLSATG